MPKIFDTKCIWEKYFRHYSILCQPEFNEWVGQSHAGQLYEMFSSPSCRFPPHPGPDADRRAKAGSPPGVGLPSENPEQMESGQGETKKLLC